MAETLRLHANSTMPAERTAALSKLTVLVQPCAAANCAIKASTKPALAPLIPFMCWTVAMTASRSASAFLKGRGVPVATATLAKLRCITSETQNAKLGPVFARTFGGRILYDEDDLIAWADQQTTRKVASTSELDAMNPPRSFACAR